MTLNKKHIQELGMVGMRILRWMNSNTKREYKMVASVLSKKLLQLGTKWAKIDLDGLAMCNGGLYERH